MTRKKLSLIVNESARRATFQKRKKGLFKKMNEISTLCGITAGVIIYSPYATNPEVWPSKADARKVIDEFKAMPEADRQKKMMDQETLLRQRITKETEHLKKQRRENREIEMTEFMFQSLKGQMGMCNLNLTDLNDLGYLIDKYLEDINRMLEISHNSNTETAPEEVRPPRFLETGSSSFAAATNFLNLFEQTQQQHLPNISPASASSSNITPDTDKKSHP